MLLSELENGEEFRFSHMPKRDFCKKRRGKLEFERHWHVEIFNSKGIFVKNKYVSTTYASFYGDQFDTEVELL